MLWEERGGTLKSDTWEVSLGLTPDGPGGVSKQSGWWGDFLVEGGNGEFQVSEKTKIRVFKNSGILRRLRHKLGRKCWLRTLRDA